MREVEWEARCIIGKIVSGTATEADRRRLDHLNWLRANSMKRPKPRVRRLMEAAQ